MKYIFILIMCIVCLFSVNANIEETSLYNDNNLLIDFSKFNYFFDEKYLHSELINPCEIKTEFNFNMNLLNYYMYCSNNNNERYLNYFNYNNKSFDYKNYKIYSQFKYTNNSDSFQVGYLLYYKDTSNFYTIFIDDTEKICLNCIGGLCGGVMNNNINLYNDTYYNIILEINTITDINTTIKAKIWAINETEPINYLINSDTILDTSLNNGTFGFYYKDVNVIYDYLFITSNDSNLSIIFPSKNIIYTEQIIDETETEVLEIGQCPSTSGGIRNLWIITIILIVLGITFVIINKSSYSIAIGLIMIIVSLSFYQCGDILNYILILIGLSYVLIGFFKKE